ncbi:hypothetical protein V8G54_010878 [Vigna mungo]|uniref:Cytochrome P450 n=1 Tax=Vigna mungo TaxID=3915 RepID=A0AAQ3S6T9_VIGMU
MQIASVKVSTNVLHVNMSASNGMSSVNKNMIHPLLPANLNQLLDKNNHTPHGSLPKLRNDLVVGVNREKEGNLEKIASGASDVRFHGFLDGTVSIVKHEDDITFLESSFAKVPCGVLEDDGSIGGGVVDNGDLIDVVGVDEDAGFEVIEVEVVGLAEVPELPAVLGSDDGGLKLNFPNFISICNWPISYPIIGNLSQLKQPYHRTFTQMAQKYGPVFSLWFGNRLVVVLTSQSAVQECFTKNDIVLANRPHFLFGKYISYNNSTILHSSYGDHWRHLRRILSLEVVSATRLNSFYEVRRDEIMRLVQKLAKLSSNDFTKVDLKTM